MPKYHKLFGYVFVFLAVAVIIVRATTTINDDGLVTTGDVNATNVYAEMLFGNGTFDMLSYDRGAIFSNISEVSRTVTAQVVNDAGLEWFYLGEYFNLKGLISRLSIGQLALVWEDLTTYFLLDRDNQAVTVVVNNSQGSFSLGGITRTTRFFQTLDNGTVTSPAYTFPSGDGMYKPSNRTGMLGFVAGGVDVINIDNSIRLNGSLLNFTFASWENPAIEDMPSLRINHTHTGVDGEGAVIPHSASQPSRSFDTTYQNDQNRTLMVYGSAHFGVRQSSENAFIELKTDSSSPPTTVVQQVGIIRYDNAAIVLGTFFNVTNGFTMIVQPHDYYRIDVTQNGANGEVIFGYWNEVDL